MSGGFLPPDNRGKILHGLVHVSDFYSVFEHLAGLSPQADRAAPAPSDSVNVWDYIRGVAAESPRTEIVHDHYMFTNASAAYTCSGQTPFSLPQYTAMGALRVGDLKLIVGPNHQASWYDLTPGKSAELSSRPNVQNDFSAYA